MTRDNPHVPTPREASLPNGDLVVAGNRQLSNRSVEVPAEDRPLYELLLSILEDSHVPDTMPARLAIDCDSLVEARAAVTDVGRARSGIAGASYGLSYLKEARQAIDEHRDRDALRLVAVGCSGSKHDDAEKMPAKDRYKGAYWSNKQDYGETCADDWRIISAEHDLLQPETAIHDYEKTPDGLRGIPIDSDERLPNGDDVTTLLDRWTLDVHLQLDEWLQSAAGGLDPRDVELEILLGKAYRGPLEDRGVFERLRIPGELDISFPFQEVEQAQGGMFEQIDWMGDAVASSRAAVTDGGYADSDDGPEGNE